MVLRFEDEAYIKQWLNFRNPTLKDMTYDKKTGKLYIDCGICRLSIIIPK